MDLEYFIWIPRLFVRPAPTQNNVDVNLSPLDKTSEDLIMYGAGCPFRHNYDAIYLPVWPSRYTETKNPPSYRFGKFPFQPKWICHYLFHHTYHHLEYFIWMPRLFVHPAPQCYLDIDIKNLRVLKNSEVNCNLDISNI